MTIEAALHTLRANPQDRAARETIALGVYDQLLAYVASLLLTFQVSPSESAHDVVHEVLLRFLERWPLSNSRIDSEFALQAYLRTSCRHLLIDQYRHERHSEQLIDFLSLRFDLAFENETDLYRSIFVKEIIAMLPEGCQSLFHQYVTEDVSPAEIADRMNESPKKFYSRWYRCIQTAKELLSKKKVIPDR